MSKRNNKIKNSKLDLKMPSAEARRDFFEEQARNYDNAEMRKSFPAESTKQYDSTVDINSPKPFSEKFIKNFKLKNNRLLSAEEVVEKRGIKNFEFSKLNEGEAKYLKEVLEYLKKANNQSKTLTIDWKEIPEDFAPYLNRVNAPNLTKLPKGDLSYLGVLDAPKMTKIPSNCKTLFTLRTGISEIPELKNLHTLHVVGALKKIHPTVVKNLRHLSAKSIPEDIVWQNLYHLDCPELKVLKRAKFPKILDYYASEKNNPKQKAWVKLTDSGDYLILDDGEFISKEDFDSRETSGKLYEAWDEFKDAISNPGKGGKKEKEKEIK